MDARELKTWMVRRLATELDRPVEDVDPEASFQALGLDSMTLIGVTGELAEVLGRDLPVEMLWEHETIAALSEELARVVGEAEEAVSGPLSGASPAQNPYLAEAAKFSPIEPVQPHGGQRPLFLAHGLTNLVVEYRLLTQHLGEDQPVFALTARGEGPARLEEMAARYVDGVRTVQRRGPYRLGGYCFGAIVAFEMARQLQAAGEEIEFLGLIDAVPPNPPRLSAGQRLARAAMLGANVLRLPAFVLGRALTQPALLPRYLSQVRSRTATKVRSIVGLPVATSSEWAREHFWAPHVDSVQANLALLGEYRPEPLAGRVCLFLSAAPTLSRADAAWRWRRLCDGVDVVRVGGLHGLMLKPPEVEQLAASMRPFLPAAGT
ncbi:MAG: non-ribosomal peptide synthetase [Planctomycetota bacterium]|jgi:thioesterase domain-containing protein/acyl carrier protein|nr:non-ribosomal peptide synthetase [Planctomycetota bacterium]MDP6988287.1 non-ribosomal peptide synthetase [Planctomycetota bacterium]